MTQTEEARIVASTFTTDSLAAMTELAWCEVEDARQQGEDSFRSEIARTLIRTGWTLDTIRAKRS